MIHVVSCASPINLMRQAGNARALVCGTGSGGRTPTTREVLAGLDFGMRLHPAVARGQSKSCGAASRRAAWERCWRYADGRPNDVCRDDLHRRGWTSAAL